MPRKPTILSGEYPYHITARTNNREWFFGQNKDSWSAFRTHLQVISKVYNAQIVSFVLMSNHFHMIVKTPDKNISSIMNYFMRETSRSIAEKTNRMNHIFGGRYKWCLIQQDDYLAHAYRYVYRNPLVAGLTKRAEDYPFSTLHCLKRGICPGFPLVDQLALQSEHIPQDLKNRFSWINIDLPSEQVDLIRRALRRSKFHFSRDRNDAKHLRELTASLLRKS